MARWTDRRLCLGGRQRAGAQSGLLQPRPGGGAHGEIASSVLLTHCARAPKEIYRDPGRLVDWVTRADAQVREAIARRTDQTGAATLAAAWFPSQSTAYLLNVGDCRVYQLKPRKQRYAIQRLTADQTYASFSEQ